MTMHFAYGANMSRTIMRRHAAQAEPLGAAELAGYRFVITADGYASVVPARGETVHGVLWRLTPRDRVTLDVWENVGGGLYRAETWPVLHAGRSTPALIYVARPGGEGRPKRGYIELVMAAAREWQLPERYVASLARWAPAEARGPRRLDLEGRA
jgi:gamma-glutamylcyclotransferase (GGCT)/AIG2-like uncharacterized protein YtfP